MKLTLKDLPIVPSYKAARAMLINNKLKDYAILIKSHCEAPDYEDTCQAPGKWEAARTFLNRMNKHGADYGLKEVLNFTEAL